MTSTIFSHDWVAYVSNILNGFPGELILDRKIRIPSPHHAIFHVLLSKSNFRESYT